MTFNSRHLAGDVRMSPIYGTILRAAVAATGIVAADTARGQTALVRIIHTRSRVMNDFNQTSRSINADNEDRFASDSISGNRRQTYGAHACGMCLIINSLRLLQQGNEQKPLSFQRAPSHKLMTLKWCVHRDRRPVSIMQATSINCFFFFNNHYTRKNVVVFWLMHLQYIDDCTGVQTKRTTERYWWTGLISNCINIDLTYLIWASSWNSKLIHWKRIAVIFSFLLDDQLNTRVPNVRLPNESNLCLERFPLNAHRTPWDQRLQMTSDFVDGGLYAILGRTWGVNLMISRRYS